MASPASASPFPALAGAPLAIAHRGGAWESPENSLVAFQRAYDLGFRYLETDVRATSDGVAVVFHDAHVNRVSREAGLIRQMPWADLQQVRIHGYQRILRLDELLERFPDATFNLDIKEASAIGPFVETVRRLRAHHRIVLASFSHSRLTALRSALGARVASSLSPREVWNLVRISRGKRAALPRSVACVQVPPALGQRPLVTEAFVEAAHSRGLQVHVWTIDEADQMHRLLHLGVDGLMTDRPSVLREVFIQRGIWRPHDHAV